MNVVSVVYGAGLTLALTARGGEVLLNPTSSAHGFASLALLDASLLGAYAFFSYSLSVGGSRAYNITWTKGDGSKGAEALRFGTDLVLAVLYVRLFLRAATVSESDGAAPRLEQYFVAYIAVFVAAAVVRRWRYGRLGVVVPQLIAAVGVTVLATVAGNCRATSTLDWCLELALLVGIGGYAVTNHLLSYRTANARGDAPERVPDSEPPRCHAAPPDGERMAG
jgi:hypothetical protein